MWTADLKGDSGKSHTISPTQISKILLITHLKRQLENVWGVAVDQKCWLKTSKITFAVWKCNQAEDLCYQAGRDFAVFTMLKRVTLNTFPVWHTGMLLQYHFLGVLQWNGWWKQGWGTIWMFIDLCMLKVKVCSAIQSILRHEEFILARKKHLFMNSDEWAEQRCLSKAFKAIYIFLFLKMGCYFMWEIFFVQMQSSYNLLCRLPDGGRQLFS